MFKSILIANRGEIAVRIIRCCNEMGIKTIAVYAEDDRQSKHVELADEAYLLTGPQLSDTYLNISKIIEISQKAQAEAIHPGYGFLAENAEFAEACEKADITFIGPSAKVIKQMGSKLAAREVMSKANIPLLPGSPVLSEFSQAREWADKIGYPILLKASAGGGGRGLKQVLNVEQLENSFHSAIREGQNYFGDSTVYLEKLLENPRHIEVQILADNHGNVIHLGERDCSIQRRHQKLIEETPAIKISSELKEELFQAAVNGAKAIGYSGAGTFEFLVDSGKFYFLEVNTRLQVEHAITEMITGIDLVREQILVANGAPLSYQQSDIHFNGHAVECRITVEDPNNNFRPMPGQIGEYIEPGGFGVRLDSMAKAHYEIPKSYDSLITKLITWAQTREAAIKRMHRALSEYTIKGVPTLINFHKWVMTHQTFINGDQNTQFIPNFFKPEFLKEETIVNETSTPDLNRKDISVEVNGKLFQVAIYEEAAENDISQPQSMKPKTRQSKLNGNNNKTILAPLAGTITQINIEPDISVEEGQLLLSIEAMKMENDITSPKTGKIKNIAVSVGENVQADALLVEFDS